MFSKTNKWLDMDGKEWICYQEQTRVNDVLPISSCHVETVVLLSHKKTDSTISVKVEFSERGKSAT